MSKFKLFHEMFGISKEDSIEVDLKVLKWFKEGLTLPQMIKKVMAIEDKKIAMAIAFRLGYFYVLHKYDEPEMAITFNQWMALLSLAEVLDENELRKVLAKATEVAEEMLKRLNRANITDVI